MALYRAYYYDGGRIFLTDDFEAENDANAVARVTTLVHPRASSREVWQHGRLVYRSRPTDDVEEGREGTGKIDLMPAFGTADPGPNS